MVDFLAALLVGGVLLAIGYFVIMPALRRLVAAQARRPLEQEDGELYAQLVMLYGRDPKVGAST